MQYRRIGTSGLKVSAISLGAWINFGSDFLAEQKAITCIHHAIEQGITFIDVADIYEKGRAEEVVGKAVKDHLRSDLVISTKAFWAMSDNPNDRGLSRKHITESVHKSLKRLNMDYVDIFFCHRFDKHTPVDETVRAIDDLIRQGKILYWGTSMWTAENIEQAYVALASNCASPPIVEQPLYNMLDRDVVEGALERAVGRHGMGLVVWSPLAQGILTGKYNDGIPEDSRYHNVDKEWFVKQLSEDRLEKARGITSLANELGVTSAALAIAWTLKHSHVASAIIGATKTEQIDENLKALDLEITDELNERIDAVLGNKPSA